MVLGLCQPSTNGVGRGRQHLGKWVQKSEQGQIKNLHVVMENRGEVQSFMITFHYRNNRTQDKPNFVSVIGMWMN